HTRFSRDWSSDVCSSDLLDPNTMSADGTVAISGLSISDDGRLAAYSIADAGSDWVKWHVREVGGEDLPDVIEWSKFSSASWLKEIGRASCRERVKISVGA